MNLYIKEIRGNFKTFLIWSIVFIAFISMYVPITDLIIEQIEPMLDFVKSMPEILLRMFNLEEELLTTPEGLFGTEGMSFVYILGAIYMTTIVGNIFAKEYENKTIEFLMGKPIKRSQIFMSKLLAILTYVVLTNIIFTFILVMEFRIFIDQSYNETILYGFGIYSFTNQMFYLAISLIVSVFFQKSSLNLGISIFVLIFMYFGDTLARMRESTEFLTKLSIYNYIPLADTILDNEIKILNSFFIIVLSLIIFLISYIIFKKKDILIN